MTLRVLLTSAELGLCAGVGFAIGYAAFRVTRFILVVLRCAVIVTWRRLKRVFWR